MTGKSEQDNKKIIHVVLNNFAPDYRVLKETTALARAGLDVSVFAKWGDNKPVCETVDNVKVRRFKLVTSGLSKRLPLQILKYFECSFRMLIRLWREKPHVVHCHDLNALLIGWVATNFFKGKLIYDSHELWSDTNERGFPEWAKKVGLSLERIMARDSREIITVSSGIAEEMERRLSVERPSVIRNVPEKADSESRSVLRERLNISEQSIVFVYIGGILANRGCETVIKAFAAADCDEAYLVFLGADEIPEWAIRDIPSEVQARIKLHPPVPPREVVQTASGCDVGIHAIRGTSLSHRYCLPNKLFEYIQAGLAVIVTDLPEMKKLVTSYEVGRVFPDGDEEALSKEIENLCKDGARLSKLKRASRHARESLCWEGEQEKLLLVYGFHEKADKFDES